MNPGPGARVVVLLGRHGSLSPLEIAAAAEGVADITFLLDTRDVADDAGGLQAIAVNLAPTVTADFGDFAACLSVLREARATVALTFTDQYCALAARLTQGFNDPDVIWGRKDRQRDALVAAAASTVRSAPVRSEDDLRAFARSVGFPVVVKPVDGYSSREVWILRGEQDISSFVAALGLGQGEALDGMFAEEFIAGEESSAGYLADYVSAELFRSGSDRAAEVSFVTDRLRPAWPCRESGIILPTQLSPPAGRQVVEAAAGALDALGVTRGSFHIEVKPRAPRPEIIEVNGRLGGFIARAVRYASGTDLGRIAIAAALGAVRGQDITWQRCVLLLQFQPPAAAAMITAAPRRREPMGLPGVLAVDELQPPGTRLNWRNGTGGATALVWVAADDHDLLRRNLIRVADFLTDHFEYVDEKGTAVRDTSWLEQVSEGFSSGDRVPDGRV